MLTSQTPFINSQFFFQQPQERLIQYKQYQLLELLTKEHDLRNIEDNDTFSITLRELDYQLKLAYKDFNRVKRDKIDEVDCQIVVALFDIDSNNIKDLLNSRKYLESQESDPFIVYFQHQIAKLLKTQSCDIKFESIKRGYALLQEIHELKQETLLN